MRKTTIAIICTIVLLLVSITPGIANESDGDLYTFCPAMCTSYYNTMMKSILNLNSAQAALMQVSYDGLHDGNLVYSNPTQDTIFFFGGATTNEYDTATTAYIHCSLKDSSTLKNVPMLIWAANIQVKYFEEITETGSSFLEWVNEDRKDGDTFNTPYFYATYNETPYDYCSLLLIIR